MKNNILIRKAAMIFTGLLFLLQSAVFAPFSRAGDILIIANKDVPVSSLSNNEIKRIFLGQKVRWDDNRIITFVILKTEAHKDFLSRYIGNTPAQYRNYWKKMVFTGKSKSPKSFKKEDELIDYIANTSGAVGYIPAHVYQDKVKIISEK